jgi:hypothetical protein
MKQTIVSNPRRSLRKAGRALLFSLLFLLIGSKGFSQESLNVSLLTPDAASSWHLLKEVDGVKISYQLSSCGPVAYVFFKAENSTSSKVSVSWSFQHFNGSRELDSNPDDENVKLDIDADGTATGGCNGAGKLNIFVKEGQAPLRITLIKLASITVASH